MYRVVYWCEVRILQSQTTITFIQSQGHKDFESNIYYKALIMYTYKQP